MKIKIIIFVALFIHAMSVSSQKITAITELYSVYNQSVNLPVFIDSTDVNGAKFNIKNALAGFIPPVTKNYGTLQVVNADTAGVFNMSKPVLETGLSYFEFKLSAMKFCKIKLQVACGFDFAVFVNGVKNDGTSSSDLKLKNASEKSIELTLLPQYYNIGVACLTRNNVDSANVLKISYTDEKSGVELVSLKADDKKKLSYQDIINVTSPYHVSISHNGTYLMNKITATLAGGEKKSWMEVIHTESQKCVLKTSAMLDANWMPLSELLYVVEKQAGVRVLKSINPATMEEKVLTENIPEGWISWSPDEKFLILSVSEKYKQAEKDLKYYILPNDRFSGWRNKTALYKYDIASGVTTQLTFGNKDVSLSDISADSKRIIIRTHDIVITKRPFSESDFYEYNLENAKIDTLWKKLSFINSVNYSPDGKKLVILGGPEAFNKLGENIGKRKYSNSYDGQAYIYDIASKKVSPISKLFNPSIQQVLWSKPGSVMYFKVVDRDYECVYSFDLSTNQFTKLALQVDVVQQIDFAVKGQYAVYRGMSASYPTKAFIFNTANNQSTVISDPEKQKMERIALGDVTDYNFKSKDGTTIYGRYYVPANFDKSKQYPMIVYYYGGTTPTSRAFGSNWNFHFWASLGYVVYVIQPSGTIGYGQEFSARHVNAWGDITADDIIQGVKSFSKNVGFVNSKKIGCLGASYGGYMTMYLQTKTDIFATAISHAGISALSSYWGNGYWGYAYSATATADTYPWNNPEFYTNHSPLFHAHKIKTPLLLIQGDDDTNVPAGESMQMFSAMKILGKEVAMIRVKNEDHIITDYQHRIDWNYSIMAWMAKYLQDDNTWWENMYPEAKK